MTPLEQLKILIDEQNYPYFEDAFLEARIEMGGEITAIARELCIQKAGIPELKLGDVIIPSPRQYFLDKATKLRTNLSGTVVRVDGRE